VPERFEPGRIADDLADCRQRGLDWLDRKSSNQVPVRAAALQQLAEDYVTARRLVAAGRVAQIKILLRDGIEELTQQGHEADASLLRDLFFGDSMHGAIKPPGELLRKARGKAGDTESRFRERRTHVMRSFAQFLIVFAASAPRRSDSRGPAVTGYVGNDEHFIQLLAEAVNVTIIGITNQRLAPMLNEALRRKRENERPDAFWGSLRVVFLKMDLLQTVNDGLEEFDDRGEALRQRHREALWARRSVGAFLKRTLSTRWAMYEYPYAPALTGALLDFGYKKIVHLLMRSPQRPRSDHLYVDLEDHTDQYFSALFEEIIHYSRSLNAIVPVGVPAGHAFRCTELRRRSEVLKDGSGESGWLPMVLIVMSRRRNGHVEPILQLRTEDNSARELNCLSHLGTHITRDDLELTSGLTLRDAPKSFHLAHEIPMHAAQRLVQEVTDYDPESALRPMATGGYLYPDKEHLFFFIFTLELPEGTQLPRRADMHPFPLPELLAVRANQVLRSAAQLCRKTGVPERVWAAAAEVVALNLYLHDYTDLAEQITELSAQQTDELAKTAAVITHLVTERTSPSWVSVSREVQLAGLAGWQYREFFSVLLPLYAEIGIDGAADLLSAVKSDDHRSAAIARLAELYQDEHLMTSTPIEL